MGFSYAAEFEKKTKTTPSEVDFEFATKLRNTITKTGVYTDRYNRHRDANEFRLLRESYPGGASAIGRIIDWYLPKMEEAVANKNKRFPIVYSAKQFRSAKLLSWIVSLMDKETEQQKDNSHEITEEIAQIIRAVKANRWPKGAAERLPQPIAATFNFLKSVRKALGVILETHPNPKMKFAAKHLLTTHVFSSTVVKRHFNNVFRQVKGWEAWSGDFKMFAIAEDSKHFHKMGQSGARMSGMSWEAILEEIKKEWSNEG